MKQPKKRPLPPLPRRLILNGKEIQEWKDKGYTWTEIGKSYNLSSQGGHQQLQHAPRNYKRNTQEIVAPMEEKPTK